MNAETRQLARRLYAAHTAAERARRGLPPADAAQIAAAWVFEPDDVKVSWYLQADEQQRREALPQRTERA